MVGPSVEDYHPCRGSTIQLGESIEIQLKHMGRGWWRQNQNILYKTSETLWRQGQTYITYPGLVLLSVWPWTRQKKKTERRFAHKLSKPCWPPRLWSYSNWEVIFKKLRIKGPPRRLVTQLANLTVTLPQNHFSLPSFLFFILSLLFDIEPLTKSDSFLRLNFISIHWQWTG